MGRVQYNGGPEGLDLRRVFWTGSALTRGDAVCCVNSTDSNVTDDQNAETSAGTRCVDSDDTNSGTEFFVGIAAHDAEAAEGWIDVIVPRRGEVHKVNLASATTVSIGDAIAVDESNANKFVGFSPAGTTAANIEAAIIGTHGVALSADLSDDTLLVKFI